MMFVLAAVLMLMRLTVLNIFMYSSPVSLLNHAHDVCMVLSVFIN